MTAIAIFSGLFCNADPVVSSVIDLNGFHLVSDHDIIMDAAGMSGLDPRAFFELFRTAETAVIPVAPRDREQRIGWLRLALAERLAAKTNVIVHGYVALLVNRELEGVLRVCLISDMKDRLHMAEQIYGLTKPDARERIRVDDAIRADWAVAVTDGPTPWAGELYDLLIPVSAVGVAQSAFLIVKQLTKVAMQDSGVIRHSMDDFLLAARVNAALVDDWHGLSVSADHGRVSVRFGDHGAAIDSLGRILRCELSGIVGVRGVEMGLGGGYWQGDICARRGRRSAAPVLDARAAGDIDSACCPLDRELAEKVGVALTGYPVSVSVRDGAVSLVINNHRAMLEVLARGLCRALAGTQGIQDIEVGVGTGYQRSAAYDEVRRQAVRLRTADEDRRFLLTRSSRLQSPARSFSVYDERAWSPERGRGNEVLVLDVNASRNNGIDILRRIKSECPDVDVLILADHESEADRAAYLGLGAFAYLPKPVNLGVLGHAIWSTGGKGRSCSP
ncbi:response regulator [Pseudodesulfovibrio sp.]|uniref:response regulator n=1 Tax=Pseudodesulfovibrio sp. TaxID=2035812 RepID=UPI00262CA3C5|nr:response regulator [Pseudodesulfovibrio sp.]MDD3313239.1 response regulator [Pseudodesulfovibrio sp.]